ncbi:MAG: thioesterase domain-containing protein [Gammaproteobacteria bacterium]|nr:thioesterase domain-containing protein [Gammaproteobacteria bacterium]MBU1777677.1 thioesterase domain-containing protein [Gammaproteobacteria bacterium]MBU1969687.1 thioesterase domain-containing protein [Gammaproteobacteria bacterium]
MKDSAARLQQTLHSDIPLTREMGITVAAYDGRQLRLAAPLTPNLNHKCTAFGGSLYSLAVLCGWGLLQLKLEEAGLHRHIVIQEADIEYLLPVAQDMEAECEVDDTALQRFMAMLTKHGRARLSLEVAIKRDGHDAVKFSGRYVVHE